MLKKLQILCFILVSLAASSCGAGKKTVKAPADNGTELSEKEKLDFAYLFYDAEKDKLLGNFGLAEEKFRQALRIQPRSAATHFELSQIYMHSGNVEMAESSIRLAMKFDSKNKWYKLAASDILEQQGKFSEIIPLMEALLKDEPAQLDYLFGLGTAQTQNKEYGAAVKTFDKVEEITGVTEELALQKKNLYMQMGKKDKAIEEIRKLMALYPDEHGYRGFIAEIYEASGEREKALAEYNEILRNDPNNPSVRFSLAEFYRRAGEKERSFEELKLAFANPEASTDLKLQVLSSYFDITAQYPSLRPQAMELCEILVKTHPDDSRVNAVYGDFLVRENKLPEALTQYKKVLESDKSGFNVWNQVLSIEAQLENYQELYDLSNEAIELFPYQPGVFLFNGIAAMQLKQYDKAIVSLKEGANVTIGNSSLSSQFYASLGDSYQYLEKYSESNEAYEKALKFEASNTYVLNNYAYYLSLRGEKLDRAKEMAARANELEPGNPSFQDTYAWVLFKMGDFGTAEQWIDKAINSGGISSATIMEHKGDILFKLGKTDDALDFWNRAKELGNKEDKLNQKIIQKKYID